MTTKTEHPTGSILADATRTKHPEALYEKLEQVSFKTHNEALAQLDEWRQQYKIPKKETVDNVHKVRIRLRPSGVFDAVLHQKKLPKSA